MVEMVNSLSGDYMHGFVEDALGQTEIHCAYFDKAVDLMYWTWYSLRVVDVASKAVGFVCPSSAGDADELVAAAENGFVPHRLRHENKHC